jgi:diguanylate cyclase (GGDEF)-like protein
MTKPSSTGGGRPAGGVGAPARSARHRTGRESRAAALLAALRTDGRRSRETADRQLMATYLDCARQLQEALDQRDQALARVAQLEHDRHHDRLTGLPNRDWLFDRFDRPRPAGLLLADLDGFKQVNDTYGHDAGDEILRAAARRFAAVPDGTAVRLHGDEFVVLLHGGPTGGRSAADWLDAVAADLAETVAGPYHADGRRITTVTASIGAVHLDGTTGCHAALRYADVAMYRAKLLRVPVVWRPSMRMPEVTATTGRRMVRDAS